MAQERPTTPEKQLLKLIEDPKEQDLSWRKNRRRSVGFFSFSTLKARFSFLLESLRSSSFFEKALLDIKGLNRILQFCIVALLAYLIVGFYMSVGRLKEVPEFVARNLRPSREVSRDVLSKKKASYYLVGPRTRDIFKFGDSGWDEEEVVSPMKEVLSEAEILAQQLSLVGTGWSDDPDVMIENVGTKKVYFLKRGQKIDGLVKVEAIFQDRVILTYDGGKEMELR